MTETVASRHLDDVVTARGWRGRRLRPSGDTAALDRPIYRSGRVYVAIVVAVGLLCVGSAAVPGLAEVIDRIDDSVARALESRRVGWVVTVASAPVLDALSGDWAWRIVRWATIAIGLAYRRLRHVLVFAAILLVVTASTTAAAELAERGPLTAVEVIGQPEHDAFPSRPVVELGLALVGVLYVLVPRGTPRNRAKVVAGAVLAPFVAARMFLGLDRLSDVFVATVLGLAVPILAFRFLVPNDSFPILYRPDHRRDVTPAQVAALSTALSDRFGWTVAMVTALRPPGSAGSTPLRIDVASVAAGRPDRYFAKLYSTAHLRSDRWYKLARAIRYGRLEDEAPFASVRHLVEHEDYLLRVAEAQGLPVPRSHGIVEVSPGREYVLVLDLLPEPRQLGDVVGTETLVDQGLQLVADLWSADIAHRDVKPANLIVADDRLYVVDLSFAEVAPTAWRQSVDLGNMLLCLGLIAPPELVVERALRQFSAEELGEAFAATAAAVTQPAQLRRLIADRDPGLPERMRGLVPARDPIGIQRWSPSRVALSLAVVAGTGAAVGLLILNVRTVGLL